MILILLLWAAMSAFTLALYGVDKRRAKRGEWRIPEKVLLGAAFFMGAPGALAGMRLFRHKTRHMSFRILVPLFCVTNAAVIILLGRGLGI